MLRKIEINPLLKARVASDLFAQNPVIIRVTKFDDDAAGKFTEEMNNAHNTGQKIIPIVVDSYGGSVFALMSMLSDIAASKVMVATVAKGKAMSCGLLLTGMGTPGYRYADKDAVFMAHEISSGCFGKNEEIKSSAKMTDRLNKKVFGLLSRNCSKTYGYFLKQIHDRKNTEWFMEPAEAKKHNLIDHIGMPSLKIKVDVTIDLENN